MDEYDSYELLQGVVDLSRKGLGPEAIPQVEVALHSKPNAVTLDLGWNNLGDDGVTGLVNMLMSQKSCRLTTIDLWANGVQTGGGKALARLLAYNTMLTSINLRKNNLGTEGALAILEALQMNSKHNMKQLDLTMNGIQGAEEAFATPLAATSLTTPVLDQLIAALPGSQRSSSKDISDGSTAGSQTGTSWASTMDKRLVLASAALSLSAYPVYEGQSSNVFHGQRWSPSRRTCEDVAVKVFHSNISDAEATSVVQKYHALHALTRFLGISEQRSSERCLITLWAGGGTVEALYTQGSPYHSHVVNALRPLYRRVRVCVDVAKALRELHTQHRLVHTAVQPRTILLDNKNRAHLCGWRHVASIGIAPPAPPVGTSAKPRAYVAPELLSGQQYSAASDMYSFGIVCCELLANQMTSASVSVASLIGTVSLSECPSDIVHLLERSISLDPADRPTMTTLLYALQEWLRQLMASGALEGQGLQRVAKSQAHLPELIREFESPLRESNNSELEDSLRSRQPHSYRSEQGIRERVLSMSLPLGGVQAQRRGSNSHQLTERSISQCEVLYDGDSKVAKTLLALGERVDGCQEQLMSACDLLDQLVPLQESVGHVSEISQSLADIYSRLGALEQKMQGPTRWVSPPRKPMEPRSRQRSDEVTFLELQNQTLHHTKLPVTTGAALAALEEAKVDSLIQSLVRLEVEKVEKQFSDRLKAIENLATSQFQQLSSKQLQLETQVQHLSAKCEPTKKGRVRLPCETKLTELQEDVSSLRAQLQTSVDKMQTQLQALSPDLRPSKVLDDAAAFSRRPEATPTSNGNGRGVAADPNGDREVDSPLQLRRASSELKKVDSPLQLRRASSELKKKPLGHVSWERFWDSGKDPGGGKCTNSPDELPEALPSIPQSLSSAPSDSASFHAPTAADYTLDRSRIQMPKGWLANPPPKQTDGVPITVPHPPSFQRTISLPLDSPGRLSAKSTSSSHEAALSVPRTGSLSPKRLTQTQKKVRQLSFEETTADMDISIRSSSLLLANARSTSPTLASSPTAASPNTRRLVPGKSKVVPTAVATRLRHISPDDRVPTRETLLLRRNSGGRLATTAASLTPAAPVSNRTDSNRSQRPHNTFAGIIKR